MQVISASRRTDIPAFYTPWLLNRLRAGSVTYPNPFSGQLYSVSLRPEDVHSITFWSKHYGPLLPHLPELTSRGYRACFHYTITGASHLLEPRVPAWPEAVRVFWELAARTSPRHVQWRFDPILFTPDLDADYYQDRFQQIAARLAGATHRCYFSFAAFYGKVERRLKQAGVQYYDPPLAEKLALVEALAGIAAEYDITLYACCQDELAGGQVQKAHCIDRELLAELFPDRPLVAEAKPTRKGCGCAASRDIGVYDTCPFGCRYCYANQDRETALARYRAHRSEGEVLFDEDQLVRQPAC